MRISSAFFAFAIYLSCAPCFCTGQIDRTEWSCNVDSWQTVGILQDCAKAIDGVDLLYWHTKDAPDSDPLPHYFQNDMQQVYQATTFTYLPRQDGSNHGNIGSWRLSLSSDGTNWRLYNGTWSDNQLLKVIDLTVPEGNPWPTRFWKLDAYSEAGSRGPWSSAAEFNVFDSSSGTTGNPAAASNTPNAHGTTTNTSPTSSQHPTTSTSLAPATASSASTSATAGGGGLSKDTQSQNKIALGVGLGVGIPTLLVTILGLFLNRNRLRAVF